MVIVSGLLFLPAVRGGYNAFYWSSRAAGVSQGVSYAEECALSGAWISLEWDRPRQQGDAIRLASRSELFGCLVDGVGLLFLPAAGYYWSASGEDLRSTVAFSLRITNSLLAPVYGMWRYTRGILRLASRSELFGCSVDGVGVSVPARCEAWDSRFLLVHF